MEFQEYRAVLEERLSPARYAHSLRVVEKAIEMAELGKMRDYGAGLNIEKLRLAALLHDYAKDMPKQKLLSLAEQYGLITSEVEKVQPDLLHGAVGAFLCERDFGLPVADEKILHAIRYHTTGCARMSLMDKIVFLADLLEPGRTYDGVDELRRICEDNLDAGLLYAFDCTLQYVITRKLLIHPLTIQARNWHLLEMDERVEEYKEDGRTEV